MKKNVTVYYSLIMAIYSIGFVAMSAFSSFYLLNNGLTSGNIGILLAVSSLVSVALEPVVGALIDRNPRISTKGVMLVVGIIVVILGLLILFIPNKSVELNTALYGISILLLMLSQPFISALGMDALNYGYPINFGIGRGMGSLGYALGSFVFGKISVIYGPKCIPIAFSTAFGILCILLFLYPVKKELKPIVTSDTSEKKSRKDNPLLFLIKYKRFAIILIGLILIYFSHCLINTFTLQIVEPKGGTSATMGTSSAIAAVCELVTTLLFAFYMKKIKLHIIIKISGIFFTLKILFSYIVTNVPAFYAIQGFQMFGWGFMAIGIIYYVNNMVDDTDKAQGQAYAGMAMTIGSVLATSVGGNIIDKFGVNTMLLTGTAAAAVGTVILWIVMKEISPAKTLNNEENKPDKDSE